MHAAEVRPEGQLLEAKKEAESLLQIGSEHRLRSENLPFDIDVWYPTLEPFTFPTEFLPLTRTEAVAILHYQDARFSERKRLTGADVGILRALERRIENVLQAKFPDGAFLRLCGRSPKEGIPLNRQGVLNRYNAELQQLLAQGEKLSANTKLRAIGRTSWLRVDTGADAMSLLLSSERVFADLHDWIEWGEPEQIVLRKFEPELVMEYEFRGFVYQGSLNALSQYDHYCVYPQLVAQKEHIQKLIFDFWNQVHSHVGEESYIMDFAYLQKADKVMLIEISPFLSCTGPALFKWSTDRGIFERGPFEFRLQTVLHDNIEDLLEVNWDDRWRGTIPRYDHFYSLATTPELSPQALVPSASTPGGNSSTPTASLSSAAAALALGAIAMASSSQDRPRLARVAAVGALSSLALAFYLHSQQQRASSFAARSPSTLCLPVVEASAPEPDVRRHLLFCYGTLKRNFHWNKKFLGQAEFVCVAQTDEPMCLVVGESGVPYLLGDQPGKGKRVKGELWRLDDTTLLGLDEYEGVGKGYYARVPISVTADDHQVHRAEVYVKISSSDKLREGPFLEEYTLEYHRANYRAIRHIMVKQQLYLNTQLGRVET